jgi:hypothetical protein
MKFSSALIVLLACGLVPTNAGTLRGNHVPLNQLSDETLGIKNGDLTPSKLAEYKTKITDLKHSLDTLMARQTVLDVEYKTLMKSSDRDKDLKRKVRGYVARSVLKGMASLTDDRKSVMKAMVDETVKQLKKEFDLKLPHPDGVDASATGGSGNGDATGATGSF